MARSQDVSKKYPTTKGLTAKTNTQTGRQMNMIPEKGTLIPERKRVGID